MSAVPLACLSSVKRSPNSYGGKPLRPEVLPMYSDTVFHGDNSWSMNSMGRAPQVGAKHFAEKYRDFGKNSQHTKNHLTFGVFSDNYVEVFAGDPSTLTGADVMRCQQSMVPTNSTKFYDTAVSQLVAQKKRVLAEYALLPKEVKDLLPLKQFAAVVMAFLTDGEDNQSVLCDEAALKRANTRHQTQLGAKILFLAANMSAEDVGAKYGIDAEDCLQMGSDEHYAEGAMQAVTSACLRGASCPSQQADGSVPARPTFSGIERQRSCGAAEALRYAPRPAPVGGRQCTAPVKGCNGRYFQPKGQPNGAPPPPPFGGGGVPMLAHAAAVRAGGNVPPRPPGLGRGYAGGGGRGCAGGGGRGCAGGGGRGCAGGSLGNVRGPFQSPLSGNGQQWAAAALLPIAASLPDSDDDLDDDSGDDSS